MKSELPWSDGGLELLSQIQAIIHMNGGNDGMLRAIRKDSIKWKYFSNRRTGIGNRGRQPYKIDEKIGKIIRDNWMLANLEKIKELTGISISQISNYGAINKLGSRNLFKAKANVKPVVVIGMNIKKSFPTITACAKYFKVSQCTVSNAIRDCYKVKKCTVRLA